MKPIWYFVGLILSIMGVVIEINGIYLLVHPSADKKVLFYLHPDIWWGGIMIIMGVIFVLKNKNVKIL
ncbi:MAG: hypothetical protein ABR980_03180 [Ignavibacteriaceae bacterium]|jgi:formate hydrogenlyase subunit 3/multisubunit Na+/H+ antiporter MnhD subunit